MSVWFGSTYNLQGEVPLLSLMSVLYHSKGTGHKEGGWPRSEQPAEVTPQQVLADDLLRKDAFSKRPLGSDWL